MEKAREHSLAAWASIRRRGLVRYLVLHGALPWGPLPGLILYLVLSFWLKFELFSFAGTLRLLACLLFFSYCGAYFAWHRWRTEEFIWASQRDGAGD
ncbi:hypothetical protein GALL_107540 [mine drainage metagenome]|uniref:Uncharacterized protein n=1 Tax=mine drainage metagenome TaxID=410659 RepID=A0A1J5ST14_9ZZZZ